MLDSNKCFTKDNERRTVDSCEDLGFEGAKSLSIAFGLKETATPCEADFAVLRCAFLLNTAFACIIQGLADACGVRWNSFESDLVNQRLE